MTLVYEAAVLDGGKPSDLQEGPQSRAPPREVAPGTRILRLPHTCATRRVMGTHRKAASHSPEARSPKAPGSVLPDSSCSRRP